MRPAETYKGLAERRDLLGHLTDNNVGHGGCMCFSLLCCV